jgi:DNA polymerase type B, organellar and viral
LNKFPVVPSWWKTGSKFQRLHSGFSVPSHVIGFDTETCRGQIETMQFTTEEERKLIWCNDENCLDIFFDFLDRHPGYTILFNFNAAFDMALVLRKFIRKFLADDFTIKYRGWECQVFCSKNWFATFRKDNSHFVKWIDIHAYVFPGTLEKVAKGFGLKIKKLPKPPNLGYVKHKPGDKTFERYAQMDSDLCYEMGIQIIGMHHHFDIPICTSSASFAEKVFRRRFLPATGKIIFPPSSAMRLAELCYHGGKNGYYLEHPALVRDCYEYDFNAAYGSAMYNLPGFMEGEYKKINKFSDKYEGFYMVEGIVQPCKYGILYDRYFNYLRMPKKWRVKVFVTSYELKEAIASGEFRVDKIRGWVWIPASHENPIKEYVKYFWEQKNIEKKGTAKYLFNKLCLNSLYGKWIQRNPLGNDIVTVNSRGSLVFPEKKDTAGGLYHPFIGALITGCIRARLHQEEHRLNAIECSTDSVKTTKYLKSYGQQKYLGKMQIETLHCNTCDKDLKKFDALFVRNRLNVLMDKKMHILKAALHGFWGNPEKLLEMWKKGENTYTVNRMPLIREGIKQSGKRLFEMGEETKNLNISWNDFKEID